MAEKTLREMAQKIESTNYVQTECFEKPTGGIVRVRWKEKMTADDMINILKPVQKDNPEIVGNGTEYITLLFRNIKSRPKPAPKPARARPVARPVPRPERRHREIRESDLPDPEPGESFSDWKRRCNQRVDEIREEEEKARENGDDVVWE